LDGRCVVGMIRRRRRHIQQYACLDALLSNNIGLCNVI
jgi:hypothetical protein